MDIIREAFQKLYPEKPFNYLTLLKYHRKLADFNANIKLYNNILQVNLNQKWQEVDQEIQIGLIQGLLQRLLAKQFNYPKQNTVNIELYNNFIKKLALITPKNKTDQTLEESFRRVNENYFYEGIDQPNLRWGAASCRKLASYNFHNDTIAVSAIFKNAPPEILDYLMYHELLHKKQQFSYKNGRNYFHTRQFRQAEKQFSNQSQTEQQIKEIVKNWKKRKVKSFFGKFWG